MSGPIPAPPEVVTEHGSPLVITGTPAAGDVLTVDGPNSAHWVTP